MENFFDGRILDIILNEGCISTIDNNCDTFKCYAFETLDCWVRRCKILLGGGYVIASGRGILDRLYPVINEAWEHQSRKVSHLMVI